MYASPRNRGCRPRDLSLRLTGKPLWPLQGKIKDSECRYSAKTQGVRVKKVVEQIYWKLVEGQRERFDKARKELVAIGKSEFNCEVTYSAMQN